MLDKDFCSFHAHRTKNLLLLVFAGLVGGCVTQPLQLPNGFAKFYQDETQNMRPEIRQRLLPASGAPQIENVPLARVQDEALRFVARGLIRIGIASFTGPAGSREQAIEQAVKVGAEFVLIGGEYSRTAQVTLPSLSVQPGQTYTTQERGTMTGSTFQGANTAFGYGSYSGSSTTTTPPTFQTQYTPLQIPIYSQVAMFWRRAKPAIFGAQFAPIPDDVRAKLERNAGVYVAAIVEGSPAFKANVLRGDVIIQFANTPVDTVQNLLDIMPSYAGQKVSLILIRDTRTLTLEAQLNEAPTMQ
ncbi:MAG: PDZ domain-containing protein [Verrucomicrobiota bacterium]